MAYSDELKIFIESPIISALIKGNKCDINAAMEFALNWAYDQTLKDSMPLGIPNSMQLANKYRLGSASILDASNNLIKYELPQVCGVGFLTSLGGLYTLPVNVASVFVLQMRLVNAIAVLAGRNISDEDVRQLTYLSMLGSQLSSVAKKKLLDGGLKVILPKVAKQLAPKMLGTSGLLKCIPAVSSIIGSSLDALTTYSILKIAQGLFLDEIISQESFSTMQEQRIRILINMAYVDTELSNEERSNIEQLILSSDFSDEKKKLLMGFLSNPQRLNVDFSIFKKEKTYAENLIAGLVSIMNADGKVCAEEESYLMEVANEVGLDKKEIAAILKSC